MLLYFFLEPGLDRKLEFLLEPVSLAKVLGATVLLPCVVSGYPPPHVRWMLGDKLVEERYEPFQLLGRDCLLVPPPPHTPLLLLAMEPL